MRFTPAHEKSLGADHRHRPDIRIPPRPDIIPSHARRYHATNHSRLADHIRHDGTGIVRRGTGEARGGERRRGAAGRGRRRQFRCVDAGIDGDAVQEWRVVRKGMSVGVFPGSDTADARYR